MEIWNKFYTMEPMKYYDAGANFKGEKAQNMVQNKNGNYIATQKFDGEWARIIKDDGKVVIQSRNISKVTGEYGNKTELVPQIVQDAMDLPDGTVLLGELCWRDITKTSKDVGTILRCLPAKAIARQKDEKLIYRVFDCLAWGGKDLSNEPYKTRFDYALSAPICTNLSFTYILPPIWVSENFEDFLQSILADGGEGIVIHSLDYKYSPGKRPAWTTLKVKKVTTELELMVVDAIAPKENYEGTEIDTWKFWKDGKPVTKPYYYGWANGVVVDNGKTWVRVTSGLTDDDRAWLVTEEAKAAIANRQLFAVVSAMEVDKESGSLRHPRLIRLRTDM